MRSAALLAAVAFSFSVASTADAQVTTSSIYIGGPQSCANTGFNDPGRLTDGNTLASATLRFTFDGSTNILILDVTNTSPIVPGQCNPILTNIWFNYSPVIDRSLIPLGATATGGAPIQWSFSGDRDLFTLPNPNFLHGFGLTNGRLLSRNGQVGGLANENADTHNQPLSSLVHGTMSISFLLSGPLVGSSHGADTFTDFFSRPRGDMKPVHAAATFSGGGPSCGAYGSVSDGVEDCFIVRGNSAGSSVFVGPDPTGYAFQTQTSNHRDHFGVSIEGPLMIPLGNFKKTRRMTNVKIDEFYVEVVMFNPTAFPLNPEQNSVGYKVEIFSSGKAKVQSYGVEDGMDLDWEVVTSWRGKRFLSFPFTIQGF